jgi:hypothetical protein
MQGISPGSPILLNYGVGFDFAEVHCVAASGPWAEYVSA